MYCRSCGNAVSSSDICPSCGVRPLNAKHYCQNCSAATRVEQEMCVKCGKILQYQKPQSTEDAPFFAKLASCCFPIVGIVLYLVWRDDKPKASSSICLWTVVGFTWPFVFYFIGALLGLVFSAPYYF